MKTIGVLAGMGPRSTSPFLELVLDQCQEQYGAKNDIDFPHILVYSLPTPFYLDRKINHEELKNSIIDGLKRLETCDVSFIAMPCNTAHKYYEDLACKVNIPLLNIIEETIHYIPKSKTITLFGTESTRKSDLYQNQFEKKGYKYIFKETWQTKINEIISMIKSGENSDKRDLIWNELLESVITEGIDTVVIACTDLNVTLESTKNKDKINFVDSSQALAKAVVREYLR